jgi:hypothetical protein
MGAMGMPYAWNGVALPVIIYATMCLLIPCFEFRASYVLIHSLDCGGR